jgi:signal transduction histidine kinase
MSLIIFASYNRLLKDKKETQLQLEYELRMRAEQRKFADIVSHEFRTPLSVVHASLGNLQVEHKDHPETIKRLERIERATERMHTLINDYLKTERLMLDAHQPQFRRHDVVKICRIAVEDLSESDRDRIEIRAAESVDVLCDMDLIRIAVHNLLNNACKHSQSTKTITLFIYRRAQSVFIDVADSGVGIAQDELVKIFDRHYRGKNLPPTEGRGLGLYIVQLIAAGHHGQVTVRSEQNAETVFTLELPA